MEYGSTLLKARVLVDFLYAWTVWADWLVVMDAKILDKALALVSRAKAFHAQSDACWHGRLGGIQGYDSQYGWPVGCYGCEAEDNEPPLAPADIYAWALATARGIRWQADETVFDWAEDIFA